MSFPLLFPVVSVTCSAEWPLHHRDLNVSHPSLIPLSLRLPTTLVFKISQNFLSDLLASPPEFNPFSSPPLLLHLYLSSSLTSFPLLDRQKKMYLMKKTSSSLTFLKFSLFFSHLSANRQYKKKKKENTEKTCQQNTHRYAYNADKITRKIQTYNWNITRPQMHLLFIFKANYKYYRLTPFRHSF